MQNPLKNMLLGTMELGLFMSIGAKRFQENRATALKSFLIPFLLLPLWVLAIYVAPTERLGQRSFGELLMLHGQIKILFALGLLGLIALLAHFTDREDKFWSFVTAVNFLSIAGLAITMPILGMAMAGWHSWDDLYAILLAAALYEFALLGFAAAYILNLPWQLAAAISFFALILHQLTSQTIFYFQGIA
jgi:hypothetical protein